MAIVDGTWVLTVLRYFPFYVVRKVKMCGADQTVPRLVLHYSSCCVGGRFR
jgi:hypothetical protein